MDLQGQRDLLLLNELDRNGGATQRTLATKLGVALGLTNLYLKRLAVKHPNIPIIIEHLDETDVPRAKKFVSGKLQALGC